MDDPTLHRVTESELPALKLWLKKYLPESFKLYNTVNETILGRWKGTTFCTLGWPDILAAGEGEISQESGCYVYHCNPRSTCVFAPNLEHLEMFLLWPGYMDWTQPMFFQGVCARLTPIIDKVAHTKGGNCTIKHNTLLEAKQEDTPLEPVPEDFELRTLEPELHSDLILSNWELRRNNSEIYIPELLRRFPSVGLFDREGNCIAYEAASEQGTLVMLHVREEFRGRGLGKVITSHLAHKYFSDGLSAMVVVGPENDSSMRMHLNCGFREVCDVDWIYYTIGDAKKYLLKIGSKAYALA